jgi:hypothetical protein
VCVHAHDNISPNIYKCQFTSQCTKYISTDNICTQLTAYVCRALLEQRQNGEVQQMFNDIAEHALRQHRIQIGQPMLDEDEEQMPSTCMWDGCVYVLSLVYF